MVSGHCLVDRVVHCLDHARAGLNIHHPLAGSTTGLVGGPSTCPIGNFPNGQTVPDRI